MPVRINKAIELLEQGQPIYYTGKSERPSYESGKAMAKTWADYIALDMEHGSFDMAGLSDFMRGLVDGGPTASGHRTPAVIMTIPTDGIDEQVMRANAWMCKQALARGVHGVVLCHAENPAAVRAFVEACRYPIHTVGVGDGLGEGRRGSGGETSAAEIWGISPEEYVQRADVWPLNPDGEIVLGIKVENTRALANAELSTKVPGVTLAEWGPGDMRMSLDRRYARIAPYSEEMLAARQKVMAACKEAEVFFLNRVTPEDVVSRIEEGVMIGSPGGGEEVARLGRAHTKRTMPV